MDYKVTKTVSKRASILNGGLNCIKTFQGNEAPNAQRLIGLGSERISTTVLDVRKSVFIVNGHREVYVSEGTSQKNHTNPCYATFHCSLYIYYFAPSGHASLSSPLLLALPHGCYEEIACW